MKVRWSEQASSQVEEATAYIAHDRPATALSWGEGLVAAMRRAAGFPFSGRPVPSLDPERFREIIYEDVRVIYRVDPGEVVILIVWHQRRDPQAEAPAAALPIRCAALISAEPFCA